MCGRYSLHASPEVVSLMFGLSEVPAFQPRYNIAPTSQVLVVRTEGELRGAAMVKWGLVPRWAKDATIGARMNNARAETVAEKPSFREAYRKRRCLIPASGFYEWKAHGKLKQPYYIHPAAGELFAFAGLWEEWRSSQGAGGGGEALVVRTFTIITVPPNDLISPYHDRMPAILSREDEAVWIGRSTRVGELGRLLRGYSPDELEVVAVSRERLTGGKS